VEVYGSCKVCFIYIYKKIFFARADAFGDPFEGAFTKEAFKMHQKSIDFIDSSEENKLKEDGYLRAKQSLYKLLAFK